MIYKKKGCNVFYRFFSKVNLFVFPDIWSPCPSGGGGGNFSSSQWHCPSLSFVTYVNALSKVKQKPALNWNFRSISMYVVIFPVIYPHYIHCGHPSLQMPGRNYQMVMNLEGTNCSPHSDFFFLKCQSFFRN